MTPRRSRARRASVCTAFAVALLVSCGAHAATNYKFGVGLYKLPDVAPKARASTIRPMWPWWMVLGFHYDVFGVHAFDRDDIAK